MSSLPAGAFGEFYYSHGCGEPYGRSRAWTDLFDHVSGRIITDLAPARVLDAGCAFGLLVEALRRKGVEAYGIDISEYAISQVAAEVKPYCRVASAGQPLEEMYDLIVTIEVLEHMPPAEAERAVENFCRHANRVLFSSSPEDYGEATHINVHPPEYWAEKFARYGFYRDVDFDASFLTPWAALFRRVDMPPHRLAAGYERRFWQLWKENTALRATVLDDQARLAQNEQDLRALRSANEALVSEKEAAAVEVAALTGQVADLRGSPIVRNAIRLRAALHTLLRR